jgi:6-phosphofructo-2-kinase/fructose-2,6-biphosphatase 2
MVGTPAQRVALVADGTHRRDKQQRAPKVPPPAFARGPPTDMRRTSIVQRVAREAGIHVIFLESVCGDPAVIAANVVLKVSSSDPDYAGMPPAQAQADFLRRIRHYESVHETITDAEPVSARRITGVGSQVSVPHIHGHLQSRISFYRMNLHLKPRSIFFSRVRLNVEGKIGGDAPLSARGMGYARTLPALIHDNIGAAPLTVWTSALQRTIQTARDPAPHRRDGMLQILIRWHQAP